MLSPGEKALENSLRRVARNRGYLLERSPVRTPSVPSYGLYRLRSPDDSAIVPYALSLDQAADALRSMAATAPLPRGEAMVVPLALLNLPEHRQIVRRWATENGIERRDRGELEESVLKAYVRAHVHEGQVGPPRYTADQQRERVRDWARSEGYEIPDDGDIPRDIIDAYNNLGTVAAEGRRGAYSRVRATDL